MMRIIILNILIFSFSFIKSNEIDIELETELFIQSTNSYGIKSNIYNLGLSSANLTKYYSPLSSPSWYVYELINDKTPAIF